VTETVQEAPELAQHRATRMQRLKLSIFSSLIFKPLAVIIPFITVPLFLKYLGTTRYGLYESIGALASWIALSNVGLSLGLVNKMTDTHVSGDRELARRYISTTMVALVVLCAVGTIALTIATFAIDWGRVFPTDDPVALRETPGAFWISGFAVFIGFIASVSSTIYVGYQEMHRHNVWDGAAKLATLIACVLVVRTPFGLLGVMFAITTVHSLVRLINTIDLFVREKPWLRPHPRLFDRTLLRGIMIESISLFILQTAAVGIFMVDKVIIGSVLGLDTVSGFAILGRVFMIAFGVFMLVLTPLWPAYGEAFRRGDFQWIRKTVRYCSALGCGAMAACGVVMFFFGDRILHIWTRGQDLDISRTLILGMTATFVARAWVDCRTVVLVGASYLVPQMYVLGANALLNIVLTIVFAKLWGVEGAVWAIPVSTLLTSGWAYPLMIQHGIRLRAAERAAAAAAAAQSRTNAGIDDSEANTAAAAAAAAASAVVVAGEETPLF